MFGLTRWRFARRVRKDVVVLGLASLMACASGCNSSGASNCDLSFKGEPRQTEWYVDEETRVAHSNIVHETPDDVRFASQPRTIADRRYDVVRELTLGECIHIALMNNKIVQTGVQAGVGQKEIFNNPDNIASIYDQAIGETGVLFGRRGVEAALSDFDTTLRSTMTWGRSSLPTNNAIPIAPFPVRASNVSETWNYTTTLSKQFATGASLQFFQNLDYTGTNSPNVGLPSLFSGNNGVQFRQPLLAGAGTEFTRIAGPTNPNFGAITGVSQGVLIARINSDISLTQFEAAVRNSMRDVQKGYWDLYLAYRNYETSVVAHRSAYQTWKEANIKLEVGTLKAADEAQALEQFYATQATTEASLNTLYKAETALRRLMGLQINDCEIIRPSETPMFGEFVPDWRAVLAEALTRRVELRRQKWNIKSLQLQLKAACSLTRPQLDVVAGATQNGQGNDLIGSSGAIGDIWSRDHGSWNFGVEYSVPIGFRSARAQVRNYELRIAKARAVLDQTEREISHDVTTAIQDVIANYTSASTNEERLVAARRRVRLLDLEREEGTTTLDLVLRAQLSLAQAEAQYHARVVDFTKAVIDLEFSKGSLLASSGVQLAEGGWDACAYEDALRRALERTYAYENPHLEQQPPAFARSVPVPGSELSPADCDIHGSPLIYSHERDGFRFDGEPIAEDWLPEEEAPKLPDGGAEEFEFNLPETDAVPGIEAVQEPSQVPDAWDVPKPASTPRAIDELLPIDSSWIDPPAPDSIINIQEGEQLPTGFGKAMPGILRAGQSQRTRTTSRVASRPRPATRPRALKDSHFSGNTDTAIPQSAGWESLPGPFYPASNRRTLSESVEQLGAESTPKAVKFGDLFRGE